MSVVQIKKGKFEGLWKAKVTFKNNDRRKGSSELFETKYDAESWLKAIKKIK